MRMRSRFMSALAAVLLLGAAAPVFADTGADASLVSALVGENGSRNLGYLALMTLLYFLPALFLVTGPFIRIIMTFSVLRTGLGLQQSPPNQVLIGLALMVSLFIMGPTYGAVYQDAVAPLLLGEITLEQAVDRGEAPLRDFMLRNAHADDLALAAKLYDGDVPASREELPFLVVSTGFILSELRAATLMGVVILVPFLLIDLFVASSLMTMGMIMVPPMMVSLPLKLLVFWAADGWALVVDSLARSFH